MLIAKLAKAPPPDIPQTLAGCAGAPVRASVAASECHYFHWLPMMLLCAKILFKVAPKRNASMTKMTSLQRAKFFNFAFVRNISDEFLDDAFLFTSTPIADPAYVFPEWRRAAPSGWQ